jgi:hypothetical protein
LIDGQDRAVPNPMSDRLGELNERRSGSVWRWGFGGEFVVAAAKILHERKSGDDHSSRAVGA